EPASVEPRKKCSRASSGYLASRSSMRSTWSFGAARIAVSRFCSASSSQRFAMVKVLLGSVEALAKARDGGAMKLRYPALAQLEQGGDLVELHAVSIVMPHN